MKERRNTDKRKVNINGKKETRCIKCMINRPRNLLFHLSMLLLLLHNARCPPVASCLSYVHLRGDPGPCAVVLDHLHDVRTTWRDQLHDNGMLWLCGLCRWLRQWPGKGNPNYPARCGTEFGGSHRNWQHRKLGAVKLL
jgi:hypothetical protein